MSSKEIVRKEEIDERGIGPLSAAEMNDPKYHSPRPCKHGDKCYYRNDDTGKGCGFVHPGEEGKGRHLFPPRTDKEGAKQTWEGPVVRLVGGATFYERRRLGLTWPEWKDKCKKEGTYTPPLPSGPPPARAPPLPSGPLPSGPLPSGAHPRMYHPADFPPLPYHPPPAAAAGGGGGLLPTPKTTLIGYKPDGTPLYGVMCDDSSKLIQLPPGYIEMLMKDPHVQEMIRKEMFKSGL
jgi:hypothetical protein